MNNEHVLKAPLGVTMGCPVGIGPEIILKFFQESGPHKNQVVVIGDLDVLKKTATVLGLESRIISWAPGERIAVDTLPVFSTDTLPSARFEWGKPNVTTARAMVRYIEQAVELIQKGNLAGMVTCPISKFALQQTGSPFPGHTEMLAALTKSGKFRMMMAGSRLRVVLVTIHEPIARVSSLLNTDEILDCITMTIHSLQHDFGIRSPKIAVAGFNPHCGEGGMFGSEEETCIAPAISLYNGPGVISGPWPPDTVFHRAAAGDFDAVISMYHDQGLIPFKLLHFKDGVNVTLGLPIIRTSVDHGTAYDIAGRGVADPASLEAAITMAERIDANRREAAQ
jgi:4-hydroxythreonine-4-phosphate dehydrogenase